MTRLLNADRRASAVAAGYWPMQVKYVRAIAADGRRCFRTRRRNKVIGRGGTLRRLSIRRVIHSFRVEQSAAPGKAVCEMTKLATGVDEAK
jgi:hypothetical protein